MSQNFYQILTNEELSQIHEASLEVLEKTGLNIDHPVAMERLAGSGARVEKARQRVYLSQDLVDIQMVIQNNYNILNFKRIKEYFELFDKLDDYNKLINDLKNAD